MAEDKISVRLETKDPNLRKQFGAIIHSLEWFYVQPSVDTRRADLLIFELENNTEKGFQLIHSLLDLEAFGEVFLTSGHSDQKVLLQAIRTGAKEFFSQPIKEQEVRQALERFKERREKSKNKKPVKIGRIIDLIGSKGGVGTTTVAVNLAVNLAKMNAAQSVALIDMNMVFGEVPLFLEMKPNYHWGEITKNVFRMDATFLMNVLSKHTSGIYVLPSPASLNGYDGATPQVMGHLLDLMQRMFDFVVIDGGPSLDETSLKILGVADIVLVVSTLSLPCLSNTNKLLKSFYDLGYPSKKRIKVVINRHLKNSEISLKDAEAGIDKKIFWTIPNDYRTTLSAINQGKPLSQLASEAGITKSLRGLADALSTREEKQEQKRWRFFKKK